MSDNSSQPKVLHVLYSFLPDVSGSSIRSSGLIAGQAARGMQIAAITSPFQPGFGSSDVDEYRQVPIHRTFKPGGHRIDEAGSRLAVRIGKALSIFGFIRDVHRVAKMERADVIHAHSTFYCALAGYAVSRMLRVPMVYEFRSLWEERARNLGLLYRIQTRISRSLETLSLRLADRVVTINQHLKDDVVARGVPADRVDVVPNAVDDALIEAGQTIPPVTAARRFGYVGNFSKIEGLNILVEAFRKAFPTETDVQLLFHGAGPFEADLRQLIEGDDRIRLCGKFRREDVPNVYASLDCIVIARHRSRLNDTVTPLKPLEAMAFHRLVGVSDARGLLEVIGSPDNAWVFKADDVGALAAGLRKAYEGEIDVRDIAARGNEFVRARRAWASVAGLYAETYSRLFASGHTIGVLAASHDS